MQCSNNKCEISSDWIHWSNYIFKEHLNQTVIKNDIHTINVVLFIFISSSIVVIYVYISIVVIWNELLTLWGTFVNMTWRQKKIIKYTKHDKTYTRIRQQKIHGKKMFIIKFSFIFFSNKLMTHRLKFIVIDVDYQMKFMIITFIPMCLSIVAIKLIQLNKN